jgi:hypothetical protein
MHTDKLRYKCKAYVTKTESLANAMDDSVKLLEGYLSQGYSVYGNQRADYTDSYGL